MATRPITIKRVMNTVSVIGPPGLPLVSVRIGRDAPAPERQGESKVGHKKHRGACQEPEHCAVR